MNKCRWLAEVERWFDGAENSDVSQHIEMCPQCAAHLETLRLLRNGVRVGAHREQIQDAQFPAFVEGIRGRLETPKGQHLGWWALTSIGAAALIVAVCTFLMFSGGPRPVRAQTVVESYSTDLVHADSGKYRSNNGTATVWVNIPRGDVL